MRSRSLAILLCSVVPLGSVAADTYVADYRVSFRPKENTALVSLNLEGKRLPSKLIFTIDPELHRNFASKEGLSTDKTHVTWRPQGTKASLTYEFAVNHQRPDGGYDSLMRSDWAVFRGDKLVPPAKVTAARGLQSKAQLRFALPKGWSVATPFGDPDEGKITFDDPKRKFDRPVGWMLVGKLGRRNERIDGVITTVAAPAGGEARRQDALAFLNWNLPRLIEVFPNFPRRLLIVMAGDPMWRGGLSGPASLFLHADRPLISENRTSTLLHELVHVAMRIRGGPKSDWIVEGFAEYYSLETLRRSGGIGEGRYNEAIASLEKWAAAVRSLRVDHSSGPVTAKAVLTLIAADREIRALTNEKHNLDDIAAALAKRGGEVTVEDLQRAASLLTGRPLSTFEKAT